MTKKEIAWRKFRNHCFNLDKLTIKYGFRISVPELVMLAENLIEKEMETGVDPSPEFTYELFRIINRGRNNQNNGNRPRIF